MRIPTKFAALAAAATLVATAAPAGAAPPVPAAPPEAALTQALPALTDALAPQLTPLVEALRRDLGLTPEQFLAQAEVGERLADARPRWEQLFRDAFGGVWLDEQGTGLVGVVTGEGGDELRAEALDAGFTVRDVALTTAQLESRHDRVLDEVENLAPELRELVTGVRVDQTRNAVVVTTRGGHAAQLGTIEAALMNLAEVEMEEAPHPLRDLAPFGSEGGTQSDDDEDGLATAGLDPATTRTGTPAAPGTGAGTGDLGGAAGSLGSLALLNETGVIPEGPLRTVVDLLSGLTTGTGSIIDGMYELEPTPETTGPDGAAPAGQRAAMQTPPADGPLVGGTGYQVPVPTGLLECSTGFTGELDGDVVVVTAAHCAGADGTRAALKDGTEFGTMTGVQRESLDTALIRVDDAVAERFATNLVGTGDGPTQPIIGTAEPVVGQKACKTGATTGYSCGTISEVGAQIDVAGSRTIDRAFTVDLCALPGDSGGVVFSGDRALGISSASNVADTGSCANAEAVAREAGLTPRLSAVPISAVLAAHPGLELRVS